MEDNGDVNHSVKMEKNVQEDKPISYGQPAYGYNLELPRKSYLPPPTGLLAEAKIADPEYGDDEEMDEIAPPSVDSKRHIKEEIAGIASPWDVTSIFEFNYFCCPECDYKIRSDFTMTSMQKFVNHAPSNHPWVS